MEPVSAACNRFEHYKVIRELTQMKSLNYKQLLDYKRITQIL